MVESKGLKDRILDLINHIKVQDSNNLDLLTGVSSVFVERDFTEILCEEDYLNKFYTEIE
jgi:hypothetical protein